MRIPRKMLFDMVMTGNLQKFCKNKKKWIKVDFSPGNEEHIHIKSMHYAEAEIDFVNESLQIGLNVIREIN